MVKLDHLIKDWLLTTSNLNPIVDCNQPISLNHNTIDNVGNEIFTDITHT